MRERERERERERRAGEEESEEEKERVRERREEERKRPGFRGTFSLFHPGGNVSDEGEASGEERSAKVRPAASSQG